MFAPTSATSPDEYIAMQPEPRRTELQQLHELILASTPYGEPFIMSGMIGYGLYRYKAKTRKEAEWAAILLAGRKAYISLYLSAMVGNQYLAESYKDKLPKADIGKSCIRIKKLADIDLDVLRSAIVATVGTTKLGELTPSDSSA